MPYLVALTQKAIEVVSRGWSWILRLSRLSSCCSTIEVNPIELVLVLFLTIELKLHLLRYTSWDVELKEAVALSLEINVVLRNLNILVVLPLEYLEASWVAIRTVVGRFDADFANIFGAIIESKVDPSRINGVCYPLM